MSLVELVTAPLLPLAPVARLRDVGLDDVAASVAGRLSAAHDDLRRAERGLAAVDAAGETLRGVLRDLIATVDVVRVAQHVDWRSPASDEHRRRADVLVAEAEARVADAEEWLALLGVAGRECEDARQDALRRIREAEEAARRALMAAAGAWAA